MTTCATCGNMGLKEDADGAICACHCEHGAVVRTHSNRDTVLAFAAREHTDAIDDRTDAIRTPPAFDAVAKKLRLEDGGTYTIQRGESVTIDVACVHLCRSCSIELLSDQPCGAMCQACSEEAAALHAQEYDPADDWLAWLLIGTVAGIVGTWGGMLAWGAL